MLERRLTDLHSIAIQGERRRTVDLDAEVRDAIRLVEERARRHDIRVSVKSPQGSSLARAEIRPENVQRRISSCSSERAPELHGGEGPARRDPHLGAARGRASSFLTAAPASPKTGGRTSSSPTTRRPPEPRGWAWQSSARSAVRTAVRLPWSLALDVAQRCGWNSSQQARATIPQE